MSKSRSIAGPTEIKSCNRRCACINPPSNIRFTFAARQCKLYPDLWLISTPLSLGPRPYPKGPNPPRQKNHSRPLRKRNHTSPPVQTAQPLPHSNHPTSPHHQTPPRLSPNL